MAYPEFSKYATGSTTGDPVSPSPVPVENESQDMTPTELLEQAFDNINRDLAEDLLQKVMDQTPRFFETLVVDLLKKMGYGGSFDDSTKVTPYVHDDGIDGIIYEDKLGLDKIYIQRRLRINSTTKLVWLKVSWLSVKANSSVLYSQMRRLLRDSHLLRLSA